MLVDINGNPLKRSELREPQTAEMMSLHREFAGHPVKGLTPSRLASILLRAEQGDIIAQHELFMDLEERDTHLFSEMSKRKSAVLELDFTVEPPRNATAAEKADAEFIDEVLQDMDNLEDVFLDLLDGIGHGFSAVEIQGWGLDNGVWQPKGFEHRPQSWFQLAQDNQNELRLRGPAGGEPLTPGLWMVHRAKARSGYITRTGLYRVLVWPFLFKNYSITDMAEMLEIYGLPIRLGKYPPGTAEGEKTTLMRAVAGLGHSAAGIIPSSMAIDFIDAAEGSADPFLAMMRYCDDAMSKAILGGTLTSNTSESGGGAHALGQVHNEVRQELRDRDAKQLADTVTRDLIAPLIHLNRPGAEGRRLPKLKFDLREPEDLSMMASALPTFVDLGMRISRDWAHEKTGIPVAQEGEEILGKAQQPTDTPPPGGKASATQEQQVKAQQKDQQTKTAALNNQPKIVAPAFNDQQQLDNAIDGIPPEQANADAQAMLKPLMDAIVQGKSELEILGLLAEAFPNADSTQLQEDLHKLLFAADTWGRLFASAERVG